MAFDWSYQARGSQYAWRDLHWRNDVLRVALGENSISEGWDFVQPIPDGPKLFALSERTMMLNNSSRTFILGWGLILLPSVGGRAQSSMVSLSPTSLNFGPTYVNKTTPPKNVTMTNTGNATLNIAGVAASGDFAQTNTCGSQIGAGGNCVISVTFTPTTTGTRTGAITITDNASGSPQSVSLTGNGIVAIASLSPTSLTFGSQNVGTFSTAQIVKLSNPGHGRLNISSIAASGDFSATNDCNGLVPPGTSCTISVIFSPTAGGTRTGKLTLTDNALDSPQIVGLTGTGSGIVVSPRSLAFGNQNVGATSPFQSVTLTNTGSNVLNVMTVVPSGDFAETNDCVGSVAAGTSCTIMVTFTPTDGGARTGTITINDSDPGSPQMVALTGFGVGVGLSPTSLSFGPQNVGTNSAPQMITLTNDAAVQLNIVSIIASGDFSETNNCGTSLPGHANCTISATFTPSAAGSRTGYITLSDSDPATLQTVNLSGSGQVSNSTVSVSPRVASLTFTQTQQFAAKISGVASTDVTWSVDGVLGGNNSVGTISTSGLYTPPGIAGSHQVRAISAADTTQSASVPVIVTNYAGTFTQHNDNARTGQNLNETVLTTGNVNNNQFGKLLSYPVDGFVYAQPLYVANVLSGQGYHNVLYVATEHDSVYAFDADGSNSTPLWKASFIDPLNGITTVPAADVQNGNSKGDITPEIGITGTPVIDSTRNVVYVVAETKEVSGNVTTYVQRLHALDITTGVEMPHSPVVIQASVPGKGAGTDGLGNVPFIPHTQNQRPGLLLLNGVVYIAWGSHQDLNPYHGWVIGYDANSLQRVAAYNNSADTRGDGIWMCGAGLAADESGNIYFTTGTNEGLYTGTAVDYNDSFEKLSTSNGLIVVDFFAPYNRASLSAANADLGSGGPLLLPDQSTTPIHLLVGGGKDGTIFLLNRDNLGGFNPYNNSQVVQSLPNILGQIRGVPAFWQNNVYFVAVSDVPKAFLLYNGRLSSAPVAVASEKIYGYPGATPTISANGTTNGIVWALRTGQYGQTPPGPAVLGAYDAANISRILYTSSQAGVRDRAGPAVKFTVPTVANGKVYVGTQNQVNVYGLLP